MMKAKKFLSLTAVVGLSFGALSLTAFASPPEASDQTVHLTFGAAQKITPEMEENSKNAIEISKITFGAPQKITPEMEANVANAIEVSPVINSMKKASILPVPFSTNISYNFWDLDLGDYIQSIDTFELTKDTQDVDLTLVQYPSPGKSGTSHLYYKFVSEDINGTDSSELGVNGNYSSSNVTITFTNVKKGTYHLLISNYSDKGGVQSDGNGYTYYY